MHSPLIAVTPLYDYERGCELKPISYLDALSKAGADCFVVSLNATNEEIKEAILKADGILFTGGNDVNPILYNEEAKPYLGKVSNERDALETVLFSEAVKKNIPVLGICRGMQLINVCLGGTLYQDLREEFSKDVSHQNLELINKGSHFVKIVKGSIINKMVGDDILLVNSNHHQGIKKISNKLTPIGYSLNDNLIEAFVNDSYPFMLGVQWHPELLIDENPIELNIFKEFVNNCQNNSLN